MSSRFSFVRLSFAFAGDSARLRGLAVYLVLALPFVGAWLLLPKPYIFSDPVGYLLRAIDLQNLADWSLRLVFDYRLGLILPHWAAFNLFGVSPAISFLPQLGFLLLLLFLVLHYCDNLLQKLASVLVMTALVPYTATVMPDLGLACMMFLALHFLGRRRGALDGALFSLAAFYAFLIKAAAGFLAVPYVAVALHSLWRGNERKGGEIDPPPARLQAAPLPRRLPLKGGVIQFFAASVVTGLALLAGYFAFYHFVYGDALIRLNTINETGELHFWNISGTDAYIQRLFIAPIPFFYQFLGIAFLLALVQAVITLLRVGRGVCGNSGARGERDSTCLISFYFLAGLLFGIFAPTSLVNWQPLPLDGRMFLFLVPPTAVLAAKFLSNLFYHSWSRTNHSPALNKPQALGESERQGQRPQPSRWGVQWAARALSILLLLSLAHPHAWQLPSALGRGLPADETNRRLTMQLLRDNDGALLLMSEHRSYRNFRIYTGFDEALYNRIRLCDAATIVPGFPDARIDDPEVLSGGSQDLIIYIDKPLSRFALRAYGFKHCNEELRQLAEAQNFATLLDNPTTYLARSQPRRESP